MFTKRIPAHRRRPEDIINCNWLHSQRRREREKCFGMGKLSFGSTWHRGEHSHRDHFNASASPSFAAFTFACRTAIRYFHCSRTDPAEFLIPFSICSFSSFSTSSFTDPFFELGPELSLYSAL